MGECQWAAAAPAPATLIMEKTADHPLINVAGAELGGEERAGLSGGEQGPGKPERRQTPPPPPRAGLALPPCPASGAAQAGHTLTAPPTRPPARSTTAGLDAPGDSYGGWEWSDSEVRTAGAAICF